MFDTSLTLIQEDGYYWTSIGIICNTGIIDWYSERDHVAIWYVHSNQNEVSATEVRKIPASHSWLFLLIIPDPNHPGNYLCLKLLLAFHAPDMHILATAYSACNKCRYDTSWDISSWAFILFIFNSHQKSWDELYLHIALYICNQYSVLTIEHVILDFTPKWVDMSISS